MNKLALRNHIKKVISEFFNNSWVYTYGPNKFPYFDDSNKTPDDLDSEFDEKFNSELDEFGENIDLEKSKKKLFIPNKH